MYTNKLSQIFFKALKFCSLLFFIFLGLFDFSFVFAVEKIGSAQVVVNKVFGGGLNHRIKQGQNVRRNEKIINGEDSAVEIKFIDGSTLFLGDESRIVLSNLVYDSNQKKVEGTFDLLSGVIRFDTGSYQMAFNLRTPNAVIGIKGTKFEVLSTPSGTEILCREGTLQVDYKNGKAQMAAGDVLMVSSSGVPRSTEVSTEEMTVRISQMLALLSKVSLRNDNDQIDKVHSNSSPAQIFSKAKGRNLEMKLLTGIVKIHLRPDLAPRHVDRIKYLTQSGFYDGLSFFNVKAGYLVETGAPKDLISEGSGKLLPAEFSNGSFVRGTVGMTRIANNPNSADSQFFITLGRAFGLDGKYTIWGEVVEGLELLDALSPGNPPKNPDKIISLKVID